MDYIRGRIDRGVIAFINMVTLSHHDYPFHDYETGTTAVSHKSYVVGDNNLAGDQKKRFVSKDTLIMCTEDCHVHFNDSENVEIDLLAGVWYTFLVNIFMIWYSRDIGVDSGTICIYTEGVLPQEARRPE